MRHQETAIVIKNIRNSATEAVDLTEIVVSLTNDVVCRVALGRKYRDEEQGMKFKEILEEFGRLLGAFSLGDFIPWLSWMNRMNGLDGRVEKVFTYLDGFLDAVVEGHIENARQKNKEGDGNEDEQEDLVDILLRIQRENAAGFAIDRESIKALILVI